MTDNPTWSINSLGVKHVLTVGTERYNITLQVIALAFVKSEKSPASIPPTGHEQIPTLSTSGSFARLHMHLYALSGKLRHLKMTQFQYKMQPHFRLLKSMLTNNYY